MGWPISGRYSPGSGVPRWDSVKKHRESTESRTSDEYRVFTDMPSSSSEYEYDGDGNDVVDFFNRTSNYDQLIRSMDRGDHDAFSAWMRGAFMHGQQYKGFDNMTADYQDMTRRFDKILDQSVVNEGITLRRLATAELVLGAGNRKVSSLAQLQALEGQVLTSKGNMSTAAAAHGLGIGSESSKDVEYVIKIPPGAKGAGMWIGDRRIGGWGAKQREFMTNRDINLRVGKTTYNSKTGKYEVEMFFDGRNEHDYGKRKK